MPCVFNSPTSTNSLTLSRMPLDHCAACQRPPAGLVATAKPHVPLPTWVAKGTQDQLRTKERPGAECLGHSWEHIGEKQDDPKQPLLLYDSVGAGAAAAGSSALASVSFFSSSLGASA